jgi:hypothetical protein
MKQPIEVVTFTNGANPSFDEAVAYLLKAGVACRPCVAGMEALVTKEQRKPVIAYLKDRGYEVIEGGS